MELTIRISSDEGRIVNALIRQLSEVLAEHGVLCNQAVDVANRSPLLRIDRLFLFGSQQVIPSRLGEHELDIFLVGAIHHLIWRPIGML